MTTIVRPVAERRGAARPGSIHSRSPRLRVMQVTQDMGIGGLERVVATIARTLDPAEFESEVLCLRDRGPIGEELIELGIPVHCLPWAEGRPDYMAFRKVERLLRERRIDVVHTHNTNALIDAGIGARLAGVRTVVHTDHARDFPDALRYRVAEHVMSHFTRKMVAVSDDGMANLRRYEWIPRRKLAVIPNGVDAERCRAPMDGDALRRELGIPAGVPVIGLGARLTEQKGVIHLIRAIPLLRATVPNLRVIIAGEGPLEAGLRTAARELGLADHVHFIGPRTDLADVMRLFDVYVLPSLWEGLPMAVLEALAAGVPLVATSVGGVPSAVRDGETGVLVRPGDPIGLATALSALLADAKRRARLATAGQLHFDLHFSARAMTDRYARLYRGSEA